MKRRMGAVDRPGRVSDLRLMVGLLGVAMVFLLASCEEPIVGDYHPNQPPETEIFVQSSNPLNPTRSVQKIYWDGRDPDGFVVGFYYTWKADPAPEDWEFTEERFGVFPLEIRSEDTTYVFQVKAVDNEGLEDPTPARQVFPIKNSPPVIEWIATSKIPDTTFTVTTFVWAARDLDGDSTIAYFEYALDDTSRDNWRRIPGYRRTLTLNADSGLTEGNHAFYIRAVDIAGAVSQTIRMPEQEDKYWYVKEPAGRYLLIDDFNVESSTTGYPDRYYKSMMDEVLGELGEGYSYWNIVENFPVSRVQFIETLKLFDRILWYSDLITESDEHFVAAQLAIPEFRAKGGKIIYTVQFNQGFGGQGNPMAFAPVDSLGRFYNIITTGKIYYPDSAFAQAFPDLPPLPTLKVSKFILGLISLIPKATAIPMYRYDDPNLTDDPIFILVGRNDNTGEYDFVFSGTPLHYLQGNNNLNEFFRIVFRDLFKP
ncbi:MAG: hypothetical protein GXO78_06075 [Calditrichaeota bacterium]|nr:hypothetical protein [Calditrichota bacterium]